MVASTLFSLAEWLRRRGHKETAAVLSRVGQRFYVTDRITGTLSRPEFFRRAEQAVRTRPVGTVGAVLLVNVDRTKHANGVLGAAGVDAALKVMAEIIRAVAPSALMGRIQGDEFAMYVARGSDAVALAETIRSKVEQRFKTLGAQVVDGAEAAGLVRPIRPALTASVAVGLSTTDAKTQTLQYLMAVANEGLCDAKDAKGNCVRVGKPHPAWVIE